MNNQNSDSTVLLKVKFELVYFDAKSAKMNFEKQTYNKLWHKFKTAKQMITILLFFIEWNSVRMLI